MITTLTNSYQRLPGNRLSIFTTYHTPIGVVTVGSIPLVSVPA